MKLYFLVGTGRSGTTWLHEVMTVLPSYRPIFEPLHPEQVRSAREFADKYLVATTPCEKLEVYLRQVCYTKTDDAWLRWLHMGISRDTPLPRKALQFVYNLPKVKAWARSRVVKFIHANLMVDWLASRFDASILFVIRNPYDVVRSQMAMGWNSDLGRFLTQSQLVDEHLADHVGWLSGLKSEPERLAAIWGIQNLVGMRLLKAHRDGRIIGRRYEDLRDPTVLSETMRRLGYTTREVDFSLAYLRFREKVRSSRRRGTGSVPLAPGHRDQISAVLDRLDAADYEVFSKRGLL